MHFSLSVGIYLHGKVLAGGTKKFGTGTNEFSRFLGLWAKGSCALYTGTEGVTPFRSSFIMMFF